jgi:6-phosphogluconolactonase (cycloisomerase 2 family)
VAVSPDGLYVYVAGRFDDSIVAFTRDPTDGTLAFLEAIYDGVGGVDGLGGASGVAVSPDGDHLYALSNKSAASDDDDALAVFARDPATGELTFVEAYFDDVGGVDGLGHASGLAVSPDGAHVYVTAEDDRSVALWDRNPTTGTLTLREMYVQGLGGVAGMFGARRPALAADGTRLTLVGFNSDKAVLFARDPATGELTFVEAEGEPALNGPSGVAVAGPTGEHAYVTATFSLELVDYAQQAGGLTPVQALSANSPQGVAAGADGLRVYLGAFNTLTTWLRNPGTGRLFEIETVDAPAGAINLSGLSLSPDGTSLYVTHSGLGLLVYDTACPTPCPFFADGFESGDLAGWSLFR